MRSTFITKNASEKEVRLKKNTAVFGSLECINNLVKVDV